MIARFIRTLVSAFIFIWLIWLILITFSPVREANNSINLENYKTKIKDIKNINYFDQVYSKDKYNVEKNADNIDINVEEWIYVTSLNNLSKKYKIHWKWFDIDLKVPGDIYLSTKGSNTIIISLNSIISINFLDKDKNKINSIMLYPHEYFIFNPKLNKIVFKKADIYRLRMLNIVKNNYKSTYIKEQLSKINQEKLKNILDKNDFLLLKNFINEKNEILKVNKKNYNLLSNAKTSNFPLMDFLRSNQKYFLNDQKKVIFLKNEIYNKLLILFQKEEFSKTEIEKIIELKKELKKLDETQYREINNFIDNVYYISLLNNNIKNHSKLENFLYLKEEKTNLAINWNFLNLKRIYINYDYYNNLNTKQFFKDFLDTYLQKSWIIEKNKNFMLNDKNKINEIESFLFYLKEYVYAHLYNDKNIKLDNEILSKYFSLNKMIYFSWEKDEVKIKTSLLENEKILKKVAKFLKNNFFEEKRKNSILVLKNTYVNLGEILSLEKEIEHITEIFKNFNNVLKKEEKQDFNKLFEEINEYFYAIKYYDKYYVEKNKEIQKLINIKWLWERTKKVYNIGDVYSYFRKFNNIYIEPRNIKKVDNYFKINNVVIYKKAYNFIFYPYDWYKLDILTKNNKFLFSFYLKQQEILWNDMYKKADHREKYKFDFKNFFAEKFKNNDYYVKQTNKKEYCRLQNKIYDEVNDRCINKKQDSDIIASFKQNKLLLEEFNVVKDFFFVKYDNLIVKQNQKWWFDIKLNNVRTVIFANEKKYDIFVNADYDLQNHYLYNISFKISRQDKNLFNNTEIELSKFKKVKLLDLKNFLENFLKKNLKTYESIYNNLRYSHIIYNFSIKNSLGKTTFEFKTNNKNIKIKFDNSKILSIIVDNRELLDSPITFIQFKNYITKF